MPWSRYFLSIGGQDRSLFARGVFRIYSIRQLTVHIRERHKFFLASLAFQNLSPPMVPKSRHASYFLSAEFVTKMYPKMQFHLIPVLKISRGRVKGGPRGLSRLDCRDLTRPSLWAFLALTRNAESVCFSGVARNPDYMGVLKRLSP